MLGKMKRKILETVCYKINKRLFFEIQYDPPVSRLRYINIKVLTLKKEMKT